MRVRNAREQNRDRERERESGERGKRKRRAKKGLSAYSYFVVYGMQRQGTA